MAAVSRYINENLKSELISASWKKTVSEASYELVKYSLIVTSIALVFFTGYISPLYGVITSLALSQPKTIQKLDSLFLSSLDDERKRARAVNNVAQKVFERYREIEFDSPISIQRKIENLGIHIEREAYYENFIRAYGERAFHQLKGLVAHTEMWKKEWSLAKQDMGDFLDEANTHIGNARREGIPSSEMVSSLQKAAIARKNAYEVEKTRFLPARLRLAYFVHVLKNIHDSRSFDEVGRFLPMNLQMRVLVAGENPIRPLPDQPHERVDDIFFITSSGKRLTRGEIASIPIAELGELITT